MARTSTTLRAHLSLVSRAGSNVELASDYRFNATLLGLGVELNRSMHVTVVGHRDSWLTELRGVRDYFLELISPIEEAVLGVKMEVNELRHVASKESEKRQ